MGMSAPTTPTPTTVPGIWALGDLANHFQLKHMANAEARLVRDNLLHPGQPRRAAFSVVPSAVFADPQVASVGAAEQELQARGRDYVTATRPYSDAAYGWALEDTTSFVKVLADPATRLLLGAHIIGPQASTLIQPLIQAMFLGNTADQIAAGVLYIHPALTEAVELACSSCETSSPRGWCREALREADGRERRRTAMARATWPGVVLAETSHPVLLEGNVHFPLGDVRTAQAQEAPEALISEGPEAPANRESAGR
jgi:hypothetical protein